MRRDDPDASELANDLALPAPPELVCRALAPLITDERLARIEAVIAQRTRSVIPVLEAVDDPRNVAAILRSADALGVQEVHLIEGEQPFLASRRITQGAERWLDLRRHATPEAAVASLRGAGFRVYVATMQGDAAPADLRGVPRVALVFGNEQSGVTQRLHALCDGRCTIPMRGFAQSLNVSVAAALALYELTRERAGDLPAEQRAELRARFMLLSVPRAAQVVTEYMNRTGAQLR
jgi:tRNA (guanosine-2'-O-)-methyltransferase